MQQGPAALVGKLRVASSLRLFERGAGLGLALLCLVQEDTGRGQLVLEPHRGSRRLRTCQQHAALLHGGKLVVKPLQLGKRLLGGIRARGLRASVGLRHARARPGRAGARPRILRFVHALGPSVVRPRRQAGPAAPAPATGRRRAR